MALSRYASEGLLCRPGSRSYQDRTHSADPIGTRGAAETDISNLGKQSVRARRLR